MKLWKVAKTKSTTTFDASQNTEDLSLLDLIYPVTNNSSEDIFVPAEPTILLYELKNFSGPHTRFQFVSINFIVINSG